MIGLPEIGTKVTIWPAPDRQRVPDGPRPIDHTGGGRFLPPEGRVVTWSSAYLEQYRAGDFLLHPPPAASPVAKTPAPPHPTSGDGKNPSPKPER